MNKKILSFVLAFLAVLLVFATSVTGTDILSDDGNDINDDEFYIDDEPYDAPSNSGVHYYVLVLDVSSSMGSMGGAPIANLIPAANNFCKQVLASGGENYIAIVAYASNADIICHFTNDLSELQAKINALTLGSNTNMIAALECADKLLSEKPNGNGITKKILFMSDGLPGVGSSESGPYTSSDSAYFMAANATYNKASELKNKGYDIYTLGFFHGVSGNNLSFAERFMKDLQSQGYYNVTNIDDLDDVFRKIAIDITGNTYHRPEYDYQPGDNNIRNYNNDPPLVLSYSLAFAIKDVPYSYFLQNNGQTTYWEIGNTLSSHGLKLMPNGEIYGVPKNIGTLTFTVGATGYSVIDPKSHNPMNSAAEIKCTLNVLDSIDANIYIKSDPGYEFTVDNIIITEIRDYEFICNGPYANFAHHVYLNDIELIERGKNSTEFDYDVREGSSIITIYAPTFANKAKNGENILIMEFNEGSGASKTLKKGVLRFTLALGGSANNSGSSANDANNQQYDDKDNPKTGAETGVWFILALALLSSSRVARAYKRKKTI
ncbi:MAG: VWA domain-containing protein [Oscillospiraceae bacterium]|nr:VWA domain-containing protein [Oscillospiraceae bacterium]